jgi:hypothetical protein
MGRKTILTGIALAGMAAGSMITSLAYDYGLYTPKISAASVFDDTPGHMVMRVYTGGIRDTILEQTSERTFHPMKPKDVTKFLMKGYNGPRTEAEADSIRRSIYAN